MVEKDLKYLENREVWKLDIENILKTWSNRRRRLFERKRDEVTFGVGDKIIFKLHIKSSLKDGITQSLFEKCDSPGEIVACLTPSPVLVKIGMIMTMSEE